MKNKNKKKTPGIVVKYDVNKIKLTSGYINAVKNLMREEILMMRKVHKDFPECWKIGVAEIEDISKANGLSIIFGSDEDKNWIKKEGQIFVEVP